MNNTLQAKHEERIRSMDDLQHEIGMFTEEVPQAVGELAQHELDALIDIHNMLSRAAALCRQLEQERRITL